MKHRGVYWRKQSNKFVVSFKVNGKAKTYGLFAEFENAVKKSEEVWLTLPIAERSQRTCDCCGLKKSNQMFYWGKPTCKECWKMMKHAPWNKWAKSTAQKLRKYSNRRKADVGWFKWARVKKSGICHRKPASSSTRALKIPATWEQWCVVERTRSMVNTQRRTRSGWDRKTKQWANGLIRREQDRLRKMSCENSLQNNSTAVR